MTLRHPLLLAVLLASCAGPSIAVPEAQRLEVDQAERYRDAVSAWIDDDDAAARELLEPLVALEPWYVPAHTLRQDALVRAGLSEAADSWYVAEAKRRPEDGARVLLAGRLAERADGRREAAYRRAHELDPGSPWAALALGIELARGALEDRRASMELDDGGYSERARVARERSIGRRQEARAVLDGVVERFPGLADVQAGAAEAFLLLGHDLGERPALERALVLADAAAALDPGHPGRHALRARVARALLRDEVAEAALRRALDLDPEDPDLLAGLGRVLLDLGRPEEARSVLQGALSERPDDAVIALDLGVAAHRTGALDAAAERFRQSAALDERLPEPLQALALVEVERGDRAAARRAIRAYLARGGTDRQWADGTLADLEAAEPPGP